MNGKCEAVLCGKSLDDKTISVVYEGKAFRYCSTGCALEAILKSLKDIEQQIQFLQSQLKR